MNLIYLAFKKWKYFILGFIVLDLIAVGLVLLYAFQVSTAERAAAAELIQTLEAPTPTATATVTPWPGPGPRATPTATLPPTPESTDVLAVSGFPHGFTPTPRPTREKVLITLPYIFPVHAGKVDVPEINQIYYPEPFFPPGSNNACGPVAVYATLLGLGASVDYTHLRDIAVNYGFTDYGITKSGVVGTLATLNQEMGSPYVIEHGNNYNIQTLAQHIRKGGVPIVLIRVRKEGGEFRVTSDQYNSIGHFLIVEQINTRTNTVKFAGSTLGMEKVPLSDFVQSWSSNPQAVSVPQPPRPSVFNPWRGPVNTEAVNWAIIVKKK
ncbi:MAG: hypothetical protein KDI02_00475 [Anaerolineae bacterium]|nr:hypothetical protein [Anaerolineae bacterium]MCB0222140.1 hypothetical protein [Anaerolineae bacterium]